MLSMKKMEKFHGIPVALPEYYETELRNALAKVGR